MTDKYIAAIGGTDDVAATTGDGTVIAVLKGLRDLLGGAGAAIAGLLGILRHTETVTLTMASGTYQSDVFDFRRFAGGLIWMPDAWTTANLGFLVAPTITGSFLPYYDATHTLVEMTSPAANQPIEMPTDAFPIHYGMLWSETSATGTLQGGGRTFIMGKKT